MVSLSAAIDDAVAYVQDRSQTAWFFAQQTRTHGSLHHCLASLFCLRASVVTLFQFAILRRNSLKRLAIRPISNRSLSAVLTIDAVSCDHRPI